MADECVVAVIMTANSWRRICLAPLIVADKVFEGKACGKCVCVCVFGVWVCVVWVCVVSYVSLYFTD